MKLRTIALFLVIVVMAVFLVINWATISTVTTVNLIYTEIQAPLGIILVAGFAALILLLLIYTVWQAASVTLELRSAYKETRSARGLADNAEKSRFAESNKMFAERLDKLEALMTLRFDELGNDVNNNRTHTDEALNEALKKIKAEHDNTVALINESVGALEKRMNEKAKKEPAPQLEAPEENDGKKKEIFEDLF